MLGTHKISIAIAVLRTSSALFSHKQLVASAKQGRNKRRAEEGSNKDILLYVTVTVTVRRVNKDILLCLLRPKDLCYLRLEGRKKYV